MKVGFVGVGAMGAAMAGQVLRRGRDEVYAYDIRPEATAAIAGQGARPVADLAEMARAADLVIVMVVDDAQVLTVAEAMAVEGAADTLIAVAATVRPATMTAVANAVAPQGLRVIDSPVCFGLSGAREGRLASLCGGAEADVDQARDVLLAYSRAVHHIGPLGTGQLAKAVNNMLHWAACVANFEALVLAKRFGLDAQALRQVLLECPARNGTLADWDTSRFTWPEKDMDIVLDLAQEGDLTLPLFGQVDQLVKLLSSTDVRDLLHGERVAYLGREIAAMTGSGAVPQRKSAG